MSGTPITTYINDRGFVWHLFEKDNVNRDAYYNPGTKSWTVSGTDIPQVILTENQEDAVIKLVYMGALE